MANLALTLCGEPGCHELVAAGRCDRHRRAQEQQRGSSSERGYTWAWRRLRRAFLRARCQSCGYPPSANCRQCGGTGLAHSCCAECLAEGKLVLATEVDHVLPHQDWPELRLDMRVLQALCQAHHTRKTNAETSGHPLSAFQQAQQARVLALLADEAADAHVELQRGRVTAASSLRTDAPQPSDTARSADSLRSNYVVGAPKLLTKSSNWRVSIGMGMPVEIYGEKSSHDHAAATCEHPRNSKTNLTIGTPCNSLNPGRLLLELGWPDPPKPAENAPIVRSPR